MSRITKKVVIVGNGGCGKTSLLTVFCKGVFPEVYDVPNVFHGYTADVEVDGRHVELSLWETPGGSHEYDIGFRRGLRQLTYTGSHVILFCFAVDWPDSLDNVQELITEVREVCPEVPIILVGCKKDLRGDSRVIEQLMTRKQILVTPEEGALRAQAIGAHHYLECSAKSGEGVLDVFRHASYAALLSRSRGHRNCVIL